MIARMLLCTTAGGGRTTPQTQPRGWSQRIKVRTVHCNITQNVTLCVTHILLCNAVTQDITQCNVLRNTQCNDCVTRYTRECVLRRVLHFA